MSFLHRPYSALPSAYTSTLGKCNIHIAFTSSELRTVFNLYACKCNKRIECTYIAPSSFFSCRWFIFFILCIVDLCLVQQVKSLTILVPLKRISRFAAATTSLQHTKHTIKYRKRQTIHTHTEIVSLNRAHTARIFSTNFTNDNNNIKKEQTRLWESQSRASTKMFFNW